MRAAWRVHTWASAAASVSLCVCVLGLTILQRNRPKHTGGPHIRIQPHWVWMVKRLLHLRINIPNFTSHFTIRMVFEYLNRCAKCVCARVCVCCRAWIYVCHVTLSHCQQIPFLFIVCHVIHIPEIPFFCAIACSFFYSLLKFSNELFWFHYIIKRFIFNHTQSLALQGDSQSFSEQKKNANTQYNTLMPITVKRSIRS